MKTHLTTFIAFLCFILLNDIELLAQTSMPVKVMSFNIKSFEGNESEGYLPFDLAPYAELIKRYNPDFIGFQELEIRTSRLEQRDVLTEMGKLLGMYPIFGWSYDKDTGFYGNGILSKYPPLASHSMLLPKPAGSSDQRSVVYVDVLLPNNKILRFINTHFDHVGGQAEQAQFIVDAYFVDDQVPAILVGDLNVSQSSALDIMLTKFERMDSDQGTFPAPTGGSKIDYILGYPKDKLKLKSTQVVTGSYVSDHCPVISEIEIKFE